MSVWVTLISAVAYVLLLWTLVRFDRLLARPRILGAALPFASAHVLIDSADKDRFRVYTVHYDLSFGPLCHCGKRLE
jgi:hypothetical protein